MYEFCSDSAGAISAQSILVYGNPSPAIASRSLTAGGVVVGVGGLTSTVSRSAAAVAAACLHALGMFRIQSGAVLMPCSLGAL